MVWTGCDAKTHRVMTFYGSDHSHDRTQEPRAVIPEVYRQQATFRPDQYEAYNGVIPAAQPKAITKKACRELSGDCPCGRELGRLAGTAAHRCSFVT